MTHSGSKCGSRLRGRNAALLLFLIIACRSSIAVAQPRAAVHGAVKHFSARDGDLFVVVFDTFHDKLNSYDIQTNPGCALRDSQSYDDGRTINANWDAVWFCQSRVVGNTLFIEEAIPFKQLRFPDTEEQ